MPNLAGKKTPFRPFFPSRTAFFPSFDRKRSSPIRRKWTSKWLFPRRHNKQKHKQNIKGISIQGLNTIVQLKKQSKLLRNEFNNIKRFMITCCIT